MPTNHALPTDATVDLSSTDATVLVVDDDEALADTYALWLREDVDVHVAYSGADALDVLDAQPVDAVLLDRRMPSMSGDAVLAAMRDRGHELRVALVTAVEPAIDVLDLPFDDYLVKPVRRGALRDTVESLLSLADHSDAFRTYYALESALSALEDAPQFRTQPDPDALVALRERVAEQRERALEAFDDDHRFEDAPAHDDGDRSTNLTDTN